MILIQSSAFFMQTTIHSQKLLKVIVDKGTHSPIRKWLGIFPHFQQHTMILQLYECL